MRKALISFVLVLTAVYLVLWVLGRRDNYVVEKEVWAANLALAALEKHPESTPRQAFEKVEKRIRDTIQKYPRFQATPTAYMLLGRSFLLQKDYKGARGVFEEILKFYPDQTQMCAQAMSAIANTYEIEGNWPEALKMYRSLQKSYPLSDLGLTVPLYIATFYASNAHDVNAENSFSEAVKYYERVSSDYPKSPVGLKALQLLSNCYIAQKKWDEAIEALKKVLFEYPTPETAAAVVQTVNTIAGGQLKDSGKAIAVYQSFIDQNPQSPLTKGLRQVIKELGSVKAPGMQANKTL